MDPKDLKITALLESIGRISSDAESRVAELRVDITRLTEENRELREMSATLDQSPTEIDS